MIPRRSMPLALGRVALFFLLLVPAAHAQTRDFRALRDSLLAADTTHLAALQTRVRTDASSVPALIEQGLLQIRIAELIGDEDMARAALRTFERASEQEPNQLWARYGLALAQLAQPEVRIGLLGGIFSKLSIAQVAAEVVGQDPRSRGMRELKRALEIDASFEPAAMTLATLALQSREEKELVAARDALRNIFPGSSNPELAILVADVAVALGDLQLAQQAADAIAASAPDSSIALHVIAEVFLRIPGQEEKGAAAYRAGIDRMTEVGATRYFEDVKMLASDLERTQWQDALDQKDIEHRRAWLRKFWSMRAARSATSEEDRIAEHYRRLDIARAKYRRSQRRGSPERYSILEEPLKSGLPYDDRGNVYLRYGDADKVIRTVADGLHPNETWVYNSVEGERRFFHFVASRGGVDFTLVDNVLAAAQDLAPTESVIRLLEDRAQLDPKFPLFATRLRGLQRLARTDSVMEEMRSGFPTTDAITSMRLETDIIASNYRKDMQLALRKDAATAEFETPIPFYYDLFGFKGTDGRTDLTAAIAIPGNLIKGNLVDGRMIYAIDLSLIVIDTLDARVERRDTTLRLWSSRPLGVNENIRLHMNLSARPSNSTIHRILVRNANDPKAGTLYGASAEVPEFNGRALMLSELVLADSSTMGAWHRDVVQLNLLPPRRITTDQMFSLFYEIYNLPAGDRYRTEIEIQPVGGSGLLRGVKRLFGGGRGEVRLSFEEESNSNLAGTDQELRRVTADLSPGRYKVNVRVTNLRSQEVASRDKLFLVVEKPKPQEKTKRTQR